MQEKIQENKSTITEDAACGLNGIVSAANFPKS